MLGASLYLAEGLEKNLEYIDRMHNYGVKTIFTSLHIPEDNKIKTLDTLKKITEKLDHYNMNLITDISSDTFIQYGVEKEDAFSFFEDLGVSSLRIDYGFSYEEMRNLAGKFQLVLNASTIDDKSCRKLEEVGLDLANIIVCHNFYPRENTGLSEDFLYERNIYLKEKGFIIQAFIAGDGERRRPIYAGLPTLEVHREMNPLEAYLDLKKNFLIDEVLIGDISMRENSLEQINKWIKDEVITLPVKTNGEYIPENFYTVHQNRKDPAADVVRSTQSRIFLKNESIEPFNTGKRPVGTVTLDNNLYGRYSGEIQITKCELPEDERINILGQVNEKSLGLLKYITADVKFKFVKDE